MELAFEETLYDSYENVYHTALLREETMEAIVPDACPDILRVLDTVVTVCLNSKQTQNGYAELSATARLEILYLPEGGGAVQRLTMSIPYRVTAESPALTDRSRLTVCLSVHRQEVRIVHSRKILARLELCFQLDAWERRQVNIPGGPGADMPQSVQTLTAQQEMLAVTGVEEKAFSFSDELELPMDLKEAALLTGQADLVCSEARVIGGKLIVKGEARLSFLLLDGEGALREETAPLPFSQIIECRDVEEEALCSVCLTLTEAAFRLAGNRVETDLGVLIQAVMRESRTVTYLTDVYSTEGSVTPEWYTGTWTELLESITRRQSVRELLETGTGVSAVLAVRVRLGKTEQDRSQGTVSAAAHVTVLYRDENGGLGTAFRSLPVTVSAELPEGAYCEANAALEDAPSATAAAGGVEVRFSVSFTLQCQSAVSIRCIVEAELSEGERSSGPSLILRRVREGERLWDVAKGCGTTVEMIRAANGMEGEELPDGRLLLIPRRR